MAAVVVFSMAPEAFRMNAGVSEKAVGAAWVAVRIALMAFQVCRVAYAGSEWLFGSVSRQANVLRGLFWVLWNILGVSWVVV